MSVQFKATVTRNSNGSVDLRPAADDAAATGIERVTVHGVGNLGPRRFSVDEIHEVTIEKSKDAAPVKVPAATKAAQRAQARADKKAADAAKAGRVADAAKAKAAAADAERRVDEGN